MDEKEFFGTMNVEFKKLNFALDSYRYCHMNASMMSDTWNGDDTQVVFMLKGNDGVEIFSYRTTVGGSMRDLPSFKKKALDLCTHTKKERAI